LARRKQFKKGNRSVVLIVSKGRYAMVIDSNCKERDLKTDVVIVGTGFAGLAAAISAHDEGAHVVLVDKMANPGGNSIISNGSYNAVNPELQHKQGIEDSANLHYQQTLQSGDFKGNSQKIRYIVDHALEGLEWLKTMGVKFRERVFQIFGGIYPRSHLAIGKGAGIVLPLLRQVKKRGIDILLNSRMMSLLRDSKSYASVMGIELDRKGKRQYIRAKKGVVLASGGFSANIDLRAKYYPLLKTLKTSNRSCATGECIIQAQNIGAKLVDMNYIQCVLAASWSGRFEHLPILCLEGIFVNSLGMRFVNEDARRDLVTKKILMQKNQQCWILFDNKASLSREITSIERDMRNGKPLYRAKSINELASKIQVSPKLLMNTMNTYNSQIENGKDEEFGRKYLTGKIDTPPFWAVLAAPSVHYTMGGLLTKELTCQVLDKSNKAIPRLYAAGEVVGGIHGTNRVGGNAIPTCVIMGRKAGELVAREV
jgi:fumarate reductase flavoprotein subunit